MNPDNLALRPNCLMTKHPLVFLTGTRSLFFYEKLGPDLQDFIAAHGYVVLSPVLPFRSPELRRQTFLTWLAWQKEQKITGFHFILSEATQKEFNEIFRGYPNCTFTLTQFKSTLTEPLSYKLHRLFCAAVGALSDPYCETLPDKSTAFYDRFLDRCVELAENETL